MVVAAAVAAASSASAEACPRLDGLPGRDLADDLRVAEANNRAARMKGLAKLDAIGASGATANRAVFFSGMTVVLALAGMYLIPTTIFRSLATGAILTGTFGRYSITVRRPCGSLIAVIQPFGLLSTA